MFSPIIKLVVVCAIAIVSKPVLKPKVNLHFD